MSVLFLQSIPVGRDTAAGIGTSGSAFLIPRGTVNRFTVTVDADSYLGVGEASSPPTASASNTTYLPASTLVEIPLDSGRKTKHYVYVYSVTSTVTAKLSYYGG